MKLFTILVLVAVCEASQILDICTTSLGLKRGIVEGNPILKKALQKKLPKWLISVKIFLPLIFILLGMVSILYGITLNPLKFFIVVEIIIVSLAVINNCVRLGSAKGRRKGMSQKKQIEFDNKTIEDNKKFLKFIEKEFNIKLSNSDRLTFPQEL